MAQSSTARLSLAVLRDVAMLHTYWQIDGDRYLCQCGEDLNPDMNPFYARDALAAHQLAMMEAAQ